MLMIIANNFCVTFILIINSLNIVNSSPFSSKITEPLSQALYFKVPNQPPPPQPQPQASSSPSPSPSPNQRRSVLSNVLKLHGIYVPKTPIRLLPKFGSIIDGSLRTKLFRWPKEPANTIEVKPMELSAFLKGLPKLTETLFADSAKLIAKPIPLKNVQNYQLLDIQSFNGQHDPSFSDGSYMTFSPQSSSIKQPLSAFNNQQKPSANNLQIQSPPILHNGNSLSPLAVDAPFFGKDNDLFSSDFDLINDKFPDNTNNNNLNNNNNNNNINNPNNPLSYWKLRPSPSTFSSGPNIAELLDFERPPPKAEPLLPRPISHSINVYPMKSNDHNSNYMNLPYQIHPNSYKANQKNPSVVRPCSLTIGNQTAIIDANSDNRLNIPNLKSGSKHGPIIFYRFDDPHIKNIPKEKLFPIFIPNHESGNGSNGGGGSTTKLEVIVKNQETVADTPKSGKSHRSRKRNRNNHSKYRENEDDFDDNNQSKVNSKNKNNNHENDYTEEYSEDLSNYEKDAENMDIFEDDDPHDDPHQNPDLHNNSNQKRGHHVHHRDSSVHTEHLPSNHKVRILTTSENNPRSSSASTSATKIIRYHAVDSKQLRARPTLRPRLRYRSDKVRIKPQASSLQHARLARGPSGGHMMTANSKTVDIQAESSDPSKIARENKVKTGDRQTFDKGVERSKHRVFEHKQEEIWKEKKWNKGGKENTEVESVGTITEKDKRNGRNDKQKALRYGDKFRPKAKRYYDDDAVIDQTQVKDGGGDHDDDLRATQVDHRYAPVTWTPETGESGWKKIYQT